MSVEAFHARVMLVLVVPVTRRSVGVVGGVVSPGLGAGFFPPGAGGDRWDCCWPRRSWPRSRGGESTHQDVQVGSPGEEAKDQTSTSAHDLCGDEDEPVQERPELHPQNGVAFGLMLVAPS